MAASPNQQTFTDWGGGYDPYTPESQPLLGPTPTFRSSKDAQLSAWGGSPDTQYPDGYLGTMSSNRRQDKILNAVQRTNSRPYTRGDTRVRELMPVIMYGQMNLTYRQD